MEAAVYREFFELEGNHWWFVGRRTLFLRMLRRALASPPKRILDVGCGTGNTVEELEAIGPTVGLDMSTEALAYCTRRRPFTLAAGTLARLPFADASFDVVTAFDVLEHDTDPAACVAEVRRVLVPGGLFLASVPAYAFMWGDHDVVAQHQRRYARREIHRLLEGAGLEVERATHLNSLLLPIAVVFRQAKNLIGRIAPREPKSDFRSTAPRGVNGVLRRVFEAEGPLLDRFDLPAGLTIACLARRA